MKCCKRPGGNRNMKCYDCFTEMELEGIGYICDPPDVIKTYYYRCPNCKNSGQREEPI